jgi:hypothetical protein
MIHHQSQKRIKAEVIQKGVISFRSGSTIVNYKYTEMFSQDF